MRTIAACLVACLPLCAQTGAKNGEWPTYGGDLGNTRYSALDQINSGNFDKLQVAWKFKTDNLGATPENNLEGTPLVVKGILYATGGNAELESGTRRQRGPNTDNPAGRKRGDADVGQWRSG